MSAPDAKATGAAPPVETRPDPIKRGLIAIAGICGFVVVAVVVKMLAAPTSTSPAAPVVTAAPAPAPDPRDAFLRQIEEAERHQPPAAAKAASAPDQTLPLSPAEQAAMDLLRRPMVVKSTEISRRRPAETEAPAGQAAVSALRAQLDRLKGQDDRKEDGR